MSRKTILIVDDDRTVREVVAVTLGSEEFHVLQAADGPEALDQARLYPPDMVLIDLMMPRMDGLEVCRRLKGDPVTAKARVIVLTARSDLHERSRALEAGVDGFFLKPFSPISLLNKVYEVLGA